MADPRIRFVAFTGSMEVGLGIQEKAARPQKGQIWMKRTVLEMGGKDPIVVDDDADLDAEALAVVQSAFGFQGQKCSACSRLVVHRKVHDALLEKVVARVKALKTGDPWEFGADLGPVINRGAFDTIRGYMDLGKKEGKVVAGGKALDRPKRLLILLHGLIVPTEAEQKVGIARARVGSLGRHLDVPAHRGKRLLLLRSTEGNSTRNLWVTDADGSDPVALTDFRTGDIADMKWSSDGSRVYFSDGESSQNVVLIRNFR